MNKACSLLVINVGSTSTKAAWFQGREPAALETIRYQSEDLAPYASLREQLPLREKGLLDFLKKNSLDPEAADLFISRGGLGNPAPAGVYRIDEVMCEDLLEGRYGKHPSALGPAMALNLSKRYGKPAIVVDPPSTDEFHPLARISGLPEIERKSVFHALNQKAAARRLASDLDKRYEALNLIVAHLGGGVTIGAHRNGKVIDCTHGLGEGPLTPERAGALPTMDLIDLVFSGNKDRKTISDALVGKGGLCAYLGTTDATEVLGKILAGDERAKLIFEAMAYQIAKEIGAMATVLEGRIDGIVLTGGLANVEMLTDWIRGRVQFIAPVFVYPGEDEMAALAEGGLRVLLKEEDVKPYRRAG